MNADEGIVEVSGSRWSNRRNATKAALEEVGEMLKRQRQKPPPDTFSEEVLKFIFLCSLQVQS